jgi:hypothetical protein
MPIARQKCRKTSSIIAKLLVQPIKVYMKSPIKEVNPLQ